MGGVGMGDGWGPEGDGGGSMMCTVHQLVRIYCTVECRYNAAQIQRVIVFSTMTGAEHISFNLTNDTPCLPKSRYGVSIVMTLAKMTAL